MKPFSNSLNIRLIGGGKSLGLPQNNHIQNQGQLCARMRMTALVAFFTLASTVMAQSAEKTVTSEPQDTAKVFVCTGPTAYACHLIQDCDGLQKCNGTIKRITVKEAKKQGRKLCGYCRRSIAIRKDGEKVTKSNEII